MTNSWYRAHMHLLIVRWIEDKSKYYNINFRYISVFKFCYNDIWLWFVPFFGAESRIMYILLVYICFTCINTQRRLQQSHRSCIYINITIWQHSIYITSHGDHWNTEHYRGSVNSGEVDLDSDVYRMASGNLRKYTTVPSQCDRLPWTWTWRLLYFDRWSHFEKRPGIV